MNQQAIREEIAKLLEVDLSAITDDLPIAEESGWDSIVIVSFVAFLMAELNCRIEIEELMATPTVGQLWPLLATKISVTP